MRTIGRPLHLAAGRTSTTSQGYGVDHQRRRRELLAVTPDGWPCPLCLQPMNPRSDPTSVDADHSVPTSLGGTLADRLTHSSCNRSRGNGTRVAKPAPSPRGEQTRTTPRAPTPGGQPQAPARRTREW